MRSSFQIDYQDDWPQIEALGMRGIMAMFQHSTHRRLGISKSKLLWHLKRVSVRFGSVGALEKVELKIEQGEVVFVTGVSGAGKTTLLRVLAGDQRSSEGQVLRKKQVFVSKIFQDLRLLGNESCERNIFQAYDRSIYKNKSEFRRDMGDFVDLLGIGDRLHLKIRHANGGLKQKVAFARAMLTRPDVILADEPTASLDYDNAKKLYDILNIYNMKRNLTVIWASHNRDLVRKFTGRIIHLEKGKLVYSGQSCFI